MTMASPDPSLNGAVLPLLSCAGYWMLMSLLVGGLANQLPGRWLRCLPVRQTGPDAPGIRRWKRWLPDAGAALPGGVRKAALSRAQPLLLARLQQETQRAELVHALLWTAWLPTALWLPPAGVLINLVFATAFNLPCLVLQRHNRRRLQRALARMRQGPRFRDPGLQPPDPAPPPVPDPRHGRRPPTGAGQAAPQTDQCCRRSRPGGAGEPST
jgi:glycosyl-4,4'-diaponeurosporenoate acyltransferase